MHSDIANSIPIPAAGAEVRYNCPFPHERNGLLYFDSDHHLYYNTQKDVYYCHRCHRKGTGKYLAKVLGSSILARGRVVARARHTETLPVDDTPTGVTYPCPMLDVYVGSEPYAYLVCDREVPLSVFDLYEVKQGTGRFSDYVFIGEYSPSGLEYWIARRFRTTDNGGPKYLNSKGARQDYVFGMYTIPEDISDLWIVEGPMTALCAPGAAIATLGCHVSADQFSRISYLSQGVDRIYYAVEQDQSEVSWAAARELARRVASDVYVVPMSDGEDLADMLSCEILDLMVVGVMQNG